MFEVRWMYPALISVGMVSPVWAEGETQDALPVDLRQALSMPEWLKPDAQSVTSLLDAPLRSLLKEAESALSDVDADKLLDLPVNAFGGVIFGQTSRKLIPLADTKGSGGETIYEVDEPLDEVEMQPLQDAVRITQCYVVSENSLKDGFATAFQFSENEGTGYSLSFVIYDYQGPGTYTFDETTLNYARYSPHALVGMVIATREIEGVATVVGQFTSTDIGGSLTIRDLPDGSMFGTFDIIALGSTDRIASQKGADDKYFVSQFSGAFRTGSLAEPVVVEFKPKPMIDAPTDIRTETAAPASNVQVLARSSKFNCPGEEEK